MVTRTISTAPVTRLSRVTQRHVGQMAAATAIFVGGVSLVAWALGPSWLTDGSFTAIRAVNPNAAAGLILLALACLLSAAQRRRATRLSLAFAGAAAVLYVAALLAYLGGPGAVLDTLLFVDTSVVGAPSRMAPQAAFSGLLLCAAVWATVLSPRGLKVGIILTVTAAAVSATVLIGHLYGADPFYQPFGVRASTPPAALALHALAVGIFVQALPAEAWRSLLTPTRATALLLRILPISLVVLVALGYVGQAGARAGWFGEEVVAAGIVVGSGLVLTVLLTRMGAQLNRYLLETQRAQARLAAANEQLHRRALELNDDVVQKLSIAWLADEFSDPRQSRAAIEHATQQAQRIASELLQARTGNDLLEPGSLRRHVD